MGKMKDAYTEEQEALYEEYLESQREELRKEGAEELRIEILRELKNQALKVAVPGAKFGIDVAIVVVEQSKR